MIKLALIGCGKWGKNYLKSVIPIDGVDITVICDPRLLQSDFSDTKVVSDYSQLDGEVDGVIIATPPATHRQIVSYFLLKQIPVLVEKPITLNSPDTDNLFATAAIRNIPILVNNIHLFSSAFEMLREDVGRWESPLTIDSVGGANGPYRDYSALFDWGPHDLSMCLSLFDGYPDNFSVYKIESERGEVYTIKLSQGQNLATLTIGNGLLTKERKFKVTCRDHQAMYDDLTESKLALDGMVCPIDTTPPLIRVLQSFTNCIKTGAVDWRFDHYLNSNVMSILDECRLRLLAQYPDFDKLYSGLPSFHSGE